MPDDQITAKEGAFRRLSAGKPYPCGWDFLWVSTGEMGQRAQSLFAEGGIKVVVGAPGDEPEKIAAARLDTPATGTNVCDH